MNTPRSSTATLIAAARELAATIQCSDGVANAALGEIAQRLDELAPLEQAAREFADAERALDPWLLGDVAKQLTLHQQFKAAFEGLKQAAREAANV